MIYYGNPSTPNIRLQMDARRLGCIVTPYQGNSADFGRWDIIADNGCFSDRWDADNWWEWLCGLDRRSRFAVCPDVVGDHVTTSLLWDAWAPRIRFAGFVPAFVCQDGATPDNIPSDATVLFIGGTTEFKLGTAAWAITHRWASSKWVHMGRVNSKRRFDTARAMRCRSVDGTFLTFGPDQNLPKLLRWVADVDTEPMLHEALRADGHRP